MQGGFVFLCQSYFLQATSAKDQKPSSWNWTTWLQPTFSVDAGHVQHLPALVHQNVGSQIVPRIIHQSWRSKKLLHFQREWQKTWLQNHPDWTYMFWTDKDNRKLVAEHYSWFLDVYDAFPLNIQRADCARYFYMLQFGGCYFDLDFESLKGLGPLLEDVHVALAYMTADMSSEISLPNAFLASVPGHDFWWYVIKQVMVAFASDDVSSSDAHRVTGPIMLKQAVARYHSFSPVKELTIFPAATVYGVDFNWRDQPDKQQIFASCHAASKSFNTTQCKTYFTDSYAITYWSGDLTWMAGQTRRM